MSTYKIEPYKAPEKENAYTSLIDALKNSEKDMEYPSVVLTVLNESFKTVTTAIRLAANRADRTARIVDVKEGPASTEFRVVLRSRIVRAIKDSSEPSAE